MNKEAFIKAIKELSINTSEDQLNDLETYYSLLIEYNKRTNLTRITDKEDVYLKHFYDSLTLTKAIKLTNQSLLDVGTRAGFPGLVLKIIFPNIKLTLVDSLNKRINFLKAVVKRLDLSNVFIYHERAEEFAKVNREKFDVVTSRAVANLQTLSEISLPTVMEGGYFIAMKAEAKKEVEQSIKAIKTLGGVLEKTIDFELPNGAGQRCLVRVRKITKTSVKYPRKFSEIKKKPL